MSRTVTYLHTGYDVTDLIDKSKQVQIKVTSRNFLNRK